MAKTRRGIGERIKQLRKERHLSQREFAERIGISQNYLSQIEKGKFAPTKPVLLAIEYLYKVSSRWIESGNVDAVIISEKPAVYGGDDEEFLKISHRLRKLYSMGGEKFEVVKRLLDILAHP
jgi:transcriptional regulator with XRE-family HTH domain